MRIQNKTFFVVVLIVICFAAMFLALSRRGEERAKDISEIESGKFNVVLIVIDTLRADHLALYDYPLNPAPFLNRIAEKSLVFENAYTTSSWTAPATASLFTSLYPFQHGVYTGMRAHMRQSKAEENIELNRIPDQITTIAEAFQDGGFKTYGVSDNLNICSLQGFVQGFNLFKTFDYAGAEKVNAQLKEWEQVIRDGGRYFLYIHYMDPHYPYHWNGDDTNAMDSEPEEIAKYDSEISYVDDAIEEMFDLYGWKDNTLLVITSDHGEEFHDHGGIQHGFTLYSEVTRIPLFFFFPEIGNEGERIKQRVSIIDILPTLRDIVGLPAGSSDEGISLVPMLSNEPLAERPLYAHLRREKGDTEKEIRMQSVVSADWKYIHSYPNTEELFNLKNDSKETVNMIDAAPEIAESLRAELIRFENTCSKYGQEKVTAPINNETRERLKSLGYVR